jgi:hypothetical protein
MVRVDTYIARELLRSQALKYNLVMHLKVGCQPQYKVQRRRSLTKERLLETNPVNHFICGLIVGLEEFVHFR